MKNRIYIALICAFSILLAVKDGVFVESSFEVWGYIQKIAGTE